MITTIPTSDARNKISAIVSYFFSFDSFLLRIERKEKKQEKESKRAISDVNSSIMLVCDVFVT